MQSTVHKGGQISPFQQLLIVSVPVTENCPKTPLLDTLHLPCVTSTSVPSSTLCLISGVANGDICFLDRERLEPKELLW